MANMERVNAYEKLHEALDTIKGHGEAGKKRDESTMADFHCCVEKYHELRPDDAHAYYYDNLSPEDQRDLFVAAAGIEAILASVSEPITREGKMELLNACGVKETGLADTLGYFRNNDHEHIKDNPCIDNDTELRMNGYYNRYSDDKDLTLSQGKDEKEGTTIIHNYLEWTLSDNDHNEDQDPTTGRHEPYDNERSFLTVSNDEKASTFKEYMEAKDTNNDTTKHDEAGDAPVTTGGPIDANETTLENIKDDEAGNQIAVQVIDVAMSGIPGFEPEKSEVVTAVGNGNIDRATTALGNLGDRINQSETDTGSEVKIHNIDQSKLSALADLVSITLPKHGEGKTEKLDLRNPWQLDAMQDINRMAFHLTKDEYKAFTGKEKPNPVAFVVQAVGVLAARIKALDPANIVSKYTQALYQGMMEYDKNKKDNIEKPETNESHISVEEMKSILTDTVQFVTIAVMDITGNDDSAISKGLRELLGEHEFESVKADLKDALENDDRDKISNIEKTIKERIEQEQKNDGDVVRNSGSYANRLQSLAALINRSKISGDSDQRSNFGRLDTKDTYQTLKMMAATFSAWREGAKADVTLLGSGTEKGHQVTFGDCIASVFTFINSDIGYTLVKYCCEKVADICREAKTDYKDLKPGDVEKITGAAAAEAVDVLAGKAEPDVEKNENGGVDKVNNESHWNRDNGDKCTSREYENGIKIVKIEHPDGTKEYEHYQKGDTEPTIINRYDKDGNRISRTEVTHNTDGTSIETTTDKNGKVINEIERNADGEEDKHDDTSADGEEDKHGDTSTDGEEDNHDDTSADGEEDKHDDTSADGEEDNHGDTSADGEEDKETGADTGDEITEKEPVEANEMVEAGEVPKEPVDNTETRGESKKAQEDQNAIDVGMAAYGEAEETKVEPATEEVAENDHADIENETNETSEPDSSDNRQDASSSTTTESADPDAIRVDTSDTSGEFYESGTDGKSNSEATIEETGLDFLGDNTPLSETPEFKEAIAEYASGNSQEGMADIYDRLSIETFTPFDESGFAQSVLEWTADAYQNGEITGNTVADMIDSVAGFYNDNVDTTTATAFDNAVDFATGMVEIANTVLENGDISLDTAKEIFETASEIATAETTPDVYDKNNFINDCINDIGRNDFLLEMLGVTNNVSENENSGSGNNEQTEGTPTVIFEGANLSVAGEITVPSSDTDLTSMPNVDSEFTAEVINNSEVDDAKMNNGNATETEAFGANIDLEAMPDALSELTTTKVEIPTENESPNVQIPETIDSSVEFAELPDASSNVEAANAVETGEEAVQEIEKYKPDETDLSRHNQQDTEYEQPSEVRLEEQPTSDEEDTRNDYDIGPTGEM